MHKNKYQSEVFKNNNKYSMNYVSMFSWIHPYALVSIGLLCLVAFSIQSELILKIIQVIVFYFIVIQLKKVKIQFFLLLILSVTFFYVLVPEGRVLYKIGPFNITDAALELGLFRGFTLTGYVFISLWSVSPKLQLPTKLGILVSQMLQYFNLLVSNSIDEKYKNFVNQQKLKVAQDKNIGLRVKFKHFTIGMIDKTDYLLLRSIEDMNRRATDSVQTELRISVLKKILGVFFVITALISTWYPILFLY